MSKSLEDVLQAAGSPVNLLRNLQTGPNVYPGVPPEFNNWRDEVQAWQKTCVLFNQSYHMADLLVEGPDALKLLSYLGVNSVAGFTVDKAKQFVPCTPAGHVIGDVILFHLAEDEFNLVGRFEQGSHDVEFPGHVDPLVDTIANFGEPAVAEEIAGKLTKWLSEGDPVEPPVAATDEQISELLDQLELERMAGNAKLTEEAIEGTFHKARRLNRGVVHPDWVAEKLAESKARLEKMKPAAPAEAAADEGRQEALAT